MLFDVIIIGAGAAGLISASTAARRGKRVLVLEHQERAGKKILISGGGRCNFTNLHSTPSNFLSSNPHFCKSALSRFTSHDFLKLIQSYEIDFFEKKSGQLFCKNSSKEIVQMLLQECEKYSVEIKVNCSVKKISKENYFLVETDQGEMKSKKLVIATGGLSFPALGATGFGYEIAKQFGLKVTSLKPALVPLLFSLEEQNIFSPLSGVSMDVSVSSSSRKNFKESMLFTHRGLSGPVILQISSYWKEKEPITLRLLPEIDLEKTILSAKQKGSKQELKNFLSQFFPKRFCEVWVQNSDSKPLQSYKDQELKKIAERLQNWKIFPSGTEGYSKAEVTHGGIDTDELSSKTMESKKVSGLYFVGEVIDVTGELGGHNFQWAWASGVAAGEALSE